MDSTLAASSLGAPSQRSAQGARGHTSGTAGTIRRRADGGSSDGVDDRGGGRGEGASLIARPPVLFLDEPTAGLDPRTRNDLWRFVEELVEAGTTVLLTTQYMEEAERLAHRIVVIDVGRVIAEGTSLELKDRLGGDTLEVRVRHAQDLERAAALVAEMVRAQPRTDANEQRLSVPTKGGTALLIAAGRRLEEAGIELDDLGIHRPSLDDVFLTLTGSATGKDEAR